VRILAFTPLHPDYGARPQARRSIRAAIDYYNGPIDWIISRNDNPHDNGHDNVTYQHNKIRDIVLNGGYDAMLSFESDVIVPEKAIQGLIDCHSDIAYGLYVWRHNLKRWSAYKELGVFGGRSFSLSHADARRAWGTVQDVAGLGMGCTLIKRHVLERLEFRLFDGRQDWLSEKVVEAGHKMGLTISPDKDVRTMVHDDWLLALEAGHYGFTQRCNFAVVCGHFESENSVLWPHIAAPDLYYVEAVA
jgi:hypothetical protein